MAVQTADGLNKAAGKVDPNSGPNITPSPDQARSTSFGRSNYGSNAYDGMRVTKRPGENVTAGLKVNADDSVMQSILEKGLRSDDAAPINTQLRDIGKNAPADHPSFASARERQASTHSASAAKVPGAISKGPSGGAGKP